MTPARQSGPVLVAGATGYIGRRLVSDLVAGGWHVRCLARTPSKLDTEPWRQQVEVVVADVLDPASLAESFKDVVAAYYLVHSIGSQANWLERDLAAARNFREAAERAGVEQIIYLGGLGDDAAGDLSPHLKSRHDVGSVLGAGAVPLTELRAAVVIGSGSASFEMLRHLVEVLPIMTTPRWVETRVQPIAVTDVLAYLVGVLGNPKAYGRTFEIGGPDVLTYRQLMQIYASVAGLRRRLILPVPVLTPRLSSLWVGLVTSIPSHLARPLIDSLINEVVVKNHSIEDVVTLAPIGCREAISQSLRHLREFEVEGRWTDAELYGRSPADPIPTDPEWSGAKVLIDRQRVASTASAEQLYAEVCALGGDRGWLVGNGLWAIRGLVDLLAGGVGMRRGRRHPTELRVGDVVDFWRVEALEPNHLLRLRAEMRLPGDAWLEWSIEGDGESRYLVQRALFRPKGLSGRLYWLTVAPFHRFIFRPLAESLVAHAEGRVGPTRSDGRPRSGAPPRRGRPSWRRWRRRGPDPAGRSRRSSRPR